MNGRSNAHPGLALLGALLFLPASFLGEAWTSVTPMPCAAAYAEDEPAKPDEGKEEEGKDDEGEAKEGESPLEACDDAKAKALAAELTKAAKKKNSDDVLPVLAKIEDLQHPEFEKPLLKLLAHPSNLVAEKAASMWEWRSNKKAARKLWSATYGDRRVNKTRFEVKALVLVSWPRAGLELSDKEFKEVEGDWRWIVGNPNPVNAPALVAIARYVELAKDKRLCRRLAEELDEPGTNVSPSDPNNPPAAWWEQRHKLWREAKPAAVSALKVLTGQEFDKTAQAKQWLEDNRKTFGFEW